MDVRLTGVNLQYRLTIQPSAISVDSFTGSDRQEELYRLTLMATHTRLTRMIGPARRHRFIRG